MKKIFVLLLIIFLLAVTICGCGNKNEINKKEDAAKPTKTITEQTSKNTVVSENGSYTSKAEVALYIHTFKKLPANFITKNEAKALGWQKQGSLDKVAPGKSIGGDHFGNFEKQLPTKKGRRYTECDIDYVKGNRGAKRIIFSNDGLIFYTDDHYKTFKQLY